MSLDFNDPANTQRISATGLLNAKPATYVPQRINMGFLSSGLGKPDPTHKNPNIELEAEKARQQAAIDLQKEQFAKSQELSNKQLELSYYSYAQSVKQGNKKSGKVICARMYDLGFIDEQTFLIDQAYGELIYRLQPEFMMWYHEKAQWFLDRMKNDTWQSKLFINLAWLFVKPWTEQMAYLMGFRKKQHLFGKILMKSFHYWFIYDKTPFFEQ